MTKQVNEGLCFVCQEAPTLHVAIADTCVVTCGNNLDCREVVRLSAAGEGSSSSSSESYLRLAGPTALRATVAYLPFRSFHGVRMTSSLSYPRSFLLFVAGNAHIGFHLCFASLIVEIGWSFVSSSSIVGMALKESSWGWSLYHCSAIHIEHTLLICQCP